MEDENGPSIADEMEQSMPELPALRATGTEDSCAILAQQGAPLLWTESTEVAHDHQDDVKLVFGVEFQVILVSVLRTSIQTSNSKLIELSAYCTKRTTG